jgi:hypothetical protein
MIFESVIWHSNVQCAHSWSRCFYRLSYRIIASRNLSLKKTRTHNVSSNLVNVVTIRINRFGKQRHPLAEDPDQGFVWNPFQNLKYHIENGRYLCNSTRGSGVILPRCENISKSFPFNFWRLSIGQITLIRPSRCHSHIEPEINRALNSSPYVKSIYLRGRLYFPSQMSAEEIYDFIVSFLTF